MRVRNLKATTISTFCLLMAGGCTVTRTVNIVAQPPDANLTLDGHNVGQGQATREVTFKSAADEHRVTASKPGYKSQTVTLTRDNPQDPVELKLRPESRIVRFVVTPTPAVVKIDGNPVSPDPVAQVSRELEFTRDVHGVWTQHVVTAERPGFAPASVTVTWEERKTDFTLDLAPMRKDVSITTTPPGAAVLLDGAPVGQSPVVLKDVPFAYDVDAGQYATHRLTLQKPGYPPLNQGITWDEGRGAYDVALVPNAKIVRVLTDPPGGTVTLNGAALARDANGVPTTQLAFPPVDERGTSKVYLLNVTKRTADSEWYPTTQPVGWDGGRTDYPVALREILTRPVPTLSVSIQRNEDGVWEILPQLSTTLSYKDAGEGGAKEPPVQLYRAPRGTTINSLTMSPDGSQLLFVLLSGSVRDDFRSQILTIRADGSGGVQQITDGRALDLMPAYTPDGDQIVFSSNRAGRRLNVWQKSTNGAPGITQLTNADEHDLWPSLDAGPAAKARLFYEVLVDARPDPQLYMSQLGTTTRTDLTSIPVYQPRISPKGDQVLFAGVNQASGKRDVYVMSDRGGPPSNLTNTPDDDDYDATWSKDGGLIAFVSDRGLDADRHRNADIWVMDPARPDRPTQVTTNGSLDDSPTWDPSGNAIYFRSNRGGEWGIWRVSLK